jgi:hypothetical protein
MPLPTIQFSKTSRTPLRVDVHIGNLVFGHYELYLWDTAGTTQTKIGEGVNSDDLPDTVALPNPPASYDGQTLQWRIDVAPLPTGDDTYKATVAVSQGKDVLPGGTFSWSGDLGDGKEIVGGAVLRGE